MNRSSRYTPHLLLYFLFLALTFRAIDAIASPQSLQNNIHIQLSQPADTVLPYQGAWQQLVSQPAFQYRDKVTQPPNQRAKGWSMLPDMEFFVTSWWGVAVCWLVIFAVLGYVLHYVIHNNILIFGRKDQQSLRTAPLDNDVNSLEWDALYHNAINAKQYRLAVRYSFMRLLQLLASKRLINYQANKTNAEYAYELHNTAHSSAFKKVTAIYETAWYGEQPIDAQTWAAYQQNIDAFTRQLK